MSTTNPTSRRQVRHVYIHLAVVCTGPTGCGAARWATDAQQDAYQPFTTVSDPCPACGRLDRPYEWLTPAAFDRLNGVPMEGE